MPPPAALDVSAPAPGGASSRRGSWRAGGPRRSAVVDAVAGLALAWLGWLGAAWARPEARFGGPDTRFDRQLHHAAPVSVWVFLALLLIAGGVAVRRRWPRVGFVLAVVGVGVYAGVGATSGPVLLAPGLVAFTMATRTPLRRWAPLTGLLLPMVWAGYVTQPYRGLLDPGLYAGLLSAVAVCVMPALFAVIRRSRRQDEARQREAELRRSAYEERLRIARDVHDVVGHSLSVVTMQAGVALHVLDKQRGPSGLDPGVPPEVTASLEAIRRTGKEALAELRTTLEVFRGAGDQPRAPQPGLARLDDLVEALRQAGRTITVVRDPAPAPLPAAVDQAAFRIIQEGLTNVVRHAGDAPAVVTVDRQPARLSVEVADTGPPVGQVVEGNGVRGMRERARAVGGTVALTPRPDGGMLLHAELPLEPAGTG